MTARCTGNAVKALLERKLSKRNSLTFGNENDGIAIVRDLLLFALSSYLHFINRSRIQTVQGERIRCVCNRLPFFSSLFLVLNRPCGLIQACIPSQLNRRGRDASINNCQIRRFHTRRQCFYLHVIQIQICIAVTIVTDSLEENRYGIIGIVTEVDFNQLPFRNTGHTAILQRDTLTVFSGNEDLSCTTGRVLPLEGQQSRLTEHNLRSSQDVIQTAGRIIRVHAKTCTFITGSIVVPTVRSGGHRSFCVVPTLRNTALQIIEVLNERHSERISIRLEGSTNTSAEAFTTLLAQIEDVISLLGQISDYQRVLSYRCHRFSGRLSLCSRQTCIYPGVAVIIIRPCSRG